MSDETTPTRAPAACTLRDARPDDLPAIVELCRAHAKYERASFREDGQVERLHQLLFGPVPRASCLVVEDGGMLVGYATWSLEFATWRAAEYVHVDCLYLTEATRGRGIGRSVMQEIARRAAALGATHLEWQTPEWNAAAARFYESLGATSSAKLRFDWNPGEGL